MPSHMLRGCPCLDTCYQDVTARPHVTRMSQLGHMLPRCHCLATCYQDVTAWPHVTKMPLLGHMLPGCRCLAICCQNDAPETHLLGIWDFASSTIIFLIYQSPTVAFSDIWTLFSSKIFLSIGNVEIVFKDSLASQPLIFLSYRHI